ncbi:MAG: SWIM zinc finger family protein [Phormidesmis sp.]
MAFTWTSEQVLALSPDAGSTQRGKALASVAKWPMLGLGDQAVWGECQGSGKQPYRTAIDLSSADPSLSDPSTAGLSSSTDGPAFRCSCPSRKFPCKHALGLFLLLAKKADFVQGQPPEWVAQWLKNRTQAETKRPETKRPETSQKAIDSAVQTEQKAKARKRAEQRSAKVAAGIADLDQWLCDIVRQGLVELPSRPYRFWDQAAARLVDAQAPGLARRVRELASIPHTARPDWPEQMLKALGKLHLLVQAYGNLETLEPRMQAEVLKQIGFPQTKEDLYERAERSDPMVSSVVDTWQVLGKVITQEAALKSQRVWLWGVRSEQAALVLNFAYGRGQPLDVSLVPGDCFDGRLIFYPGTGVLRAIVAERLGNEKLTATTRKATDRKATEAKARRGSRQSARKGEKQGIGCEQIDDAIAHYAHALGQNPWQAEFPLVLAQALLRYSYRTWWVQDIAGQRLAISPAFTQGWEVLAMSGGRRLTVFGEWDGERLLPLSAWSEKTFVALGVALGD